MKKLLSLLLVLLVIVGCSKGVDANSAQASAQKFVDALVKYDMEKMNEVMKDPQEIKESDKANADEYRDLFQKLFQKGMKAVEEKVAEDGKTAEVKVTSELPDIEELKPKFIQIITQVMFDKDFQTKTEEEQKNFFMEKLGEAIKEVKTVTKEASLFLEKVGEDWKVSNLDDKNKDFFKIFIEDFNSVDRSGF